jgi:two-component system chemotaxis response regulator CheY
MLTTESQDQKKQAGKAAGASGWIVKPFRGEQLLMVAKKFRFIREVPAWSYEG